MPFEHHFGGYHVTFISLVAMRDCSALERALPHCTVVKLTFHVATEQ